MEVMLAGLKAGRVPPDVALWLLELRGLPFALDHLDLPAAARSRTLEDLSGEALSSRMQDEEEGALALGGDMDSDSSSSSDSDRSADSLEEAALALPLALPPQREDLLTRLSGGECYSLPPVMEEDEENVTEDTTDDITTGDMSTLTTVLRARASSSSLPAPPRRRARSDGDLPSNATSSSWSMAPRRSSEPRLVGLFASTTSSPWPSPTLTASSQTLTDNTSSLSAACTEALESTVALCKDLEQDTDRTLSQSVSVDEDMVFDDEFLALCSEANRLAETCLYPDSASPAPPTPPPPPCQPGTESSPGTSPTTARGRPKFDINSIFDCGGPDPPRPPARKRGRNRVVASEASTGALDKVLEVCSATDLEQVVQCIVPSPAVVRCQTSELLLITRATECTLVKRSRSVSTADREHRVVHDSPASLCASSPELSSHQDDSLAGQGADVDLDAFPVPVPRRKGSVSSDVVAWQSELLLAALSESEDDVDPICLETKQWFSSSDNKGRVYFFEENSNESSWNLPDINFSLSQEHTFDEETNQPSDNKAPLALQNEDEMGKAIKTERSGKHEKLSLRTTKSRSMVIVDAGVGKDAKNSFVSRNWPQLFDGDMCVLKEGTMHRTKITENGKKLRKNWASSHVVLTELFLLLFRDAKAFAAMKSASHGSSTSRPELCVDLNGALIEQVDRGDKASVTSRKNVFLVSTVLGLQVLFQCDCYQQAEEWYNAVHTAIHNLPSGFDSCPRIKVTKEMDRLFAESNSPEQTKKFPRISRSKSVKIKNKDGSIEDLTVSVAERQTKIRARLKKFFNRRPTMESLVKKGIWKDEPAFGCYLDQVCGNESPRVPLFVQRCISVIESSEDNMKTDGLYRASGNLSQVQKIRLQVDQNNLSALEQEEDVHVLTGALKLFFRELKEPLIPYTAFSKAIKASTIQNKKEKVAQFRDIVKSLPSPNHDTLKVLLKHLLKVTGYQEFNRMHIPNLAIVFGPTLMWPEQESLNMALDLMQQNLVIEAFLLDFESIFR